MSDPNIIDYFVGDRVGASVTFETPEGVLADPTTVTARVLKPSGALVDYGAGDVIREGVGRYSVVVTIDEAGRWYFLFEGSGALVAAPEGHFDVREGRVPR